MEPIDNEITVMFADIAGSTRLYEVMGDQIAEELISKTLKQLSNIIIEANGDIIKTIGDELMCHFPQANDAIKAANKMHQFLAEKTAPSRDYKLAIRIGAHQGPVIKSEGDIFGDTVNIAARVTALARGGKTMITGYAYEQLTGPTREHCRHIMQTTVKGKEQPIDVYDVAWEKTDELTRIVGHNIPAELGNILTIQYDESIIAMSARTITRATIGRGKECNLIVPSPQASREHCSIECKLGKFIFCDNSSNGSYLNHNQIELFFHQEKVPLLGKGTISLGEPSADNSDFLLNYSIELADNGGSD